MSAGVDRRERYLLTAFFRTYNISQAPPGGGMFNGITKDRKKRRFDHYDFPMLLKWKIENVLNGLLSDFLS